MKNVLLIDDCAATHRLVAAELAPEDVRLTCRFDGVSGIHAAIELQPDVILLDVSMPGLDGLQTCELLKVQAETSQIPVIFLSAAGGVNSRVQGLESGAADYIAKPFHGAELRARVRVSLAYRTLLERESRRAMRDGLTGLWNRAYLNDRMAAEIEACTRHGRELSAIMFDLDHFKSLNDKYGHATGDDALRAVAGLLPHVCRGEDLPCRYGGEEFVVLCPDVGLDGAATLAERIRSTLEALVVKTPLGDVNVTCSLGVSELARGTELLASADAALYRAKRSGRNRVALARETPECKLALAA